MDRLFLDANVLFSAAYKAGARVLQLWELTDVVLCSSRYALEEARVNLSEEGQQRKLAKLSEALELSDPGDRQLARRLHLPDKDLPILLAAIEARADYLLTGDFRHFGRYFGKKLEGVVVVSPAQYLKTRNRSR